MDRNTPVFPGKYPMKTRRYAGYTKTPDGPPIPAYRDAIAQIESPGMTKLEHFSLQILCAIIAGPYRKDFKWDNIPEMAEYARDAAETLMDVTSPIPPLLPFFEPPGPKRLCSHCDAGPCKAEGEGIGVWPMALCCGGEAENPQFPIQP